MQNGESRMANVKTKGKAVESVIRIAIARPEQPIRHSAITMVELLVVVVVIGILISAILTASSALIGRSKVNNTKAVLQVVADAVEEFKREQTTKPTIASAKQAGSSGRVVKYSDRYGMYPPDELELFTLAGLPGAQPGEGTLAPKGATINPSPGGGPYPLMMFHTQGGNPAAHEHRDLVAMIVAIESYGQTSSSILSRLPDKARTAGVLDPATGSPSQFLDRPPTGWDANDGQIRYIVDEWGVPISYLSQRDFKKNPPGERPNIPSSNHAGWNEASTELIRMNGGQPIVFSYGPDGKEQLTADAMGNNNGKASLVGDFEVDDGSYKAHIIDHPMNADNVYINAALGEKLAKMLE